jgi:FSR family fosmidomycin resistance protein-like MFS transporter
VAHFSIDLYSGALGAFQPHLVSKLGLTLRQAGIIGGVMIFFSSVMQPVYGYLSDRLHSRMFTVLAPAVAGLFISALGMAPHFWAVLVMAALGGVGIASFHPQASAWTASFGAPATGRSMAAFVSAGTLGMALGPTYFSTVIGSLGLENAIWAGIPGAAVTALLLWKLTHTSLPSLRSPRIDWAALQQIRKPLFIHYLLVFIRSVVQVTYAQLLPLYLFRERGFGIQEANYALSLYIASGAVGGFVGGHLADRFGGRNVILVSMLGSVPLLSLFFLADGPLALVSLALGGFVLLFTIPVNVVMAQKLAPSQAGTVSALMMGFAWGMAGLVFIPVTGWFSDLYSMHTGLSSLLLFPIAGFFLTLKLPR